MMIKRLSLLLFACVLTVATVSAQVLKGKVFDDNGEPVSAATVAIKELNRGAVSDEDGKFRFTGIENGRYTVIVRLVGYKTQEQIINIRNNESHLKFELKQNTELQAVEVFGERYKQPEKLDAITRMPLRPSEQIQSISVISEKVIQEQGALTITDVVRNVPGVTLFGSYGGVTESMSTRGYRGVPVLKNGVRVDSDFRTAALASDMQGVESVQVLKGSAAITQGVGNDLGSPGGIINVVTKTPKFTNKGEVGIRTGSWGQFRPTFDVQSVLNKEKTVAFRLNGAYERGDGFKRLVKTNRIYVNPSLAWNPDSKTNIVLEVDYLDANKTPDIGTVNLADNDTYALYKDAREKYFGFDADNSNSKILTYAARITREIASNLSVRAAYFSSQYDSDNTISNISSLVKKGEYDKRYRNSSRNFGSDKNSTFQLDLVGRDMYTGSIKHTFQVGFDYKRNSNTQGNYGFNTFKVDEDANGDPIKGEAIFQTSLPMGIVDVFAPQSGINTTFVMPTQDPNFPSDKLTWVKGPATSSSESSYGIMLQEVMTINDYVKAILGVRYSSKLSREDKSAAVVRGDAWNPMAGLMVTPFKNVNVFGSYTTTTSLRSAAQKMENGKEIGASTSTQWETGIKSDWLDNRLRFNFTYFHIMNKNLSNRAYKPGTSTPEDFFYKAGNLRRDGIETELSGRILKNLQVMLGYAYLNARYEKSPSYVEGSAPMNAPKHTANGWAQYAFDKSVLKGFSIGVGVYYVGDRPVNEWNKLPDGHGTQPGKPFDMPAYTTVNAQLSYTYGALTARVFFNNIFDEIGYSSYYRGGYINQIDPRNFAGYLSYSF